MGEKADVKVVCYIKFQYNKTLKRFKKKMTLKIVKLAEASVLYIYR